MPKFFNRLFFSHQVCSGFDTLPLKEEMLIIYILSIMLLRIYEKKLTSRQERRVFGKQLNSGN